MNELKNMPVSIVEDEQGMLESLMVLFEEDGFSVNGFSSAEDFFMASDRPSRCIYLVDWNLPGIKGLDVIKAIRKNDAVSPIFMVTAYNSSEQMVLALESGADDYITKPFNYDTLLIKVKNASIKACSINEKLLNLGIHVMEEANSIIRDGITVSLTTSEFAIFSFLYKNKNVVSSRDNLLKKLDNSSEIGGTSRNVDVHISSLRKKLVRVKMNIETVRGIGYKLIL
jgi:DNA-binding response OmpR family regulator